MACLGERVEGGNPVYYFLEISYHQAHVFSEYSLGSVLLIETWRLLLLYYAVLCCLMSTVI